MIPPADNEEAESVAAELDAAPRYTVHKPDGYTKVKLPGLTAWVAALRSGEYKQCKGTLCDGSAYCCLGVLSKIQGRLTYEFLDGKRGSNDILSTHNPLWLILQGEGVLLKGCSVNIKGRPSPRSSLAGCNDSGLTFLEIADILEELYEEGEG